MVIPNIINKVVRDLKMPFIRGPRNKKFKNRWAMVWAKWVEKYTLVNYDRGAKF